MSSRILQDEEERLRQKLKRKAEERKSTGNGNSEKTKETERLPDSNGQGYQNPMRNQAPIETDNHKESGAIGKDDRSKTPTSETYKDKKSKRNRDEFDGSTDMRKRNNNPPSRPIILHEAPRGTYGRLPPPNFPSHDGRGGPYHDYPPRRDDGRGGPYHDYPPRRDDGRGGPYHDYPPRRDDGPPFFRGEPIMEFPPRYREDDRPPFRGEGPRGGGYYPPPHMRMDDFPPREPVGYRGSAPPPPGRPPSMQRKTRDVPIHDRGIDEFQNRRPINSRRPSRSASSERSDRSNESRSTSSDRSSESSRSVSSSDRSSGRSGSERDSASSRRDRKDTMESSDQDSRQSKPRQTPKNHVHPNEKDSLEIQIPKDKRTIFVSQLVMRVNEDDLYRFFRSECGCKVVDVIFLRDKRTGRHKGCSYVELGRLEDIPRAMEWNDKAPPFQRFPIAIKPPDLSFLTTDATAAYLVGLAEGSEKAVEVFAESAIQSSSLGSSNALNVYVGNIDRNVTQPQLQAIFSQFGDLEKVSLQVDVATGISKGFAFFGFRDPKVANLCIQVMSGQLIAGRPLRTGWANSKSDQSAVSTEFPPNVAQRIRMVDEVLVRLNGTGLSPIHGFDWSKVISSQGDDDNDEKSSMERISSAAEIAINAALGVSNNVKDVGKSISSLLDPSVIGNNDKPTSCILVHNMFDKDQETDAGWAEDIELEFADECGKYGKLLKIRVMSEEVGGKIYALFQTVDGARDCATCLAGRWFDKRQLRVEFVSEDTLSY